MSFNGIFVWDAKNGLPTSHDDAIEMEQQISHHAAKEVNPAFIAVAQAVQDFVKEAQEYYDDEMLNIYSNITESMADFTEPVLSFEHVPEELVQEFSGVIVKAAQDNNLVVLHQEIGVTFLPDGGALTKTDTDLWDDFADITLANWQDKLKELKAENENRDQLPSTSAPLKKLINQIVRTRLKDAGITKIKKLYPTVFMVDCGRIQLCLGILPEIDHLYNIEEGILRVEFLNFLNIYLNDITQVSEEWRNFHLKTEPLVFYKEDYDLREYRISRQYCNRVYTLAEFENEIHRCVDMMLYFYNACSSLSTLYNRLVADKDDRLSLHKNNYGDYIPQPDVLLIMAKLTKQQNYDELVPYYRREYIEYRTTMYRHNKELFEKSEQERSEQWPDYKKRQFQEVLDPQATFEFEIDELIVTLAKLDVDAILDAPPNKRENM